MKRNQETRHDPRPGRWDVDELIIRIKALVRVRDELRSAGGSDREIQARSLEIGILQTRLASEVRRSLAAREQTSP